MSDPDELVKALRYWLRGKSISESDRFNAIEAVIRDRQRVREACAKICERSIKSPEDNEAGTALSIQAAILALDIGEKP